MSESYHRRSLYVKIAFVEELWWSEKSPEEYSSVFLDFLRGLKTVLLLLDLDNCTDADNREYAEELRITHQNLLSCREWTIMYMDLEGKWRYYSSLASLKSSLTGRQLPGIAYCKS